MKSISVSVTIIVLIFGSCSSAPPKESQEVVETTTAKQAFRQSDIEFDIDTDTDISSAEREEIKSEILKQFVDPKKVLPVDGSTAPPPPTCFCPKIFGPVVCDSEGESHNNICNFNCEQYRSAYKLTPRKVLVKVQMGMEKEACKLPPQ